MGHTKTNWEKRALAAEAKLHEINLMILRAASTLNLEGLEKLCAEHPEINNEGTCLWCQGSMNLDTAVGECCWGRMQDERRHYKALAEELTENQKNGHLWPAELIKSDELAHDGNPVRLAWVPTWCIDKILQDTES